MKPTCSSRKRLLFICQSAIILGKEEDMKTLQKTILTALAVTSLLLKATLLAQETTTLQDTSTATSEVTTHDAPSTSEATTTEEPNRFLYGWNNGNVYLAQPPLYRITHGGKTFYAQNDAEKDKIIKTQFKNAAKVEVGRFKGLGEMLPAQLRDTTMSLEKRTLQRVIVLPEENLEDFVDRLMGKNPEARYNFIYENAALIEDVDL